MIKNKKHLIYAEDLIYEIMIYPSRNLSKGLIRNCTNKVIREKEVSIWQAIWNKIKELFGR